jgi:hypothetical protein
MMPDPLYSALIVEPPPMDAPLPAFRRLKAVIAKNGLSS